MSVYSGQTPKQLYRSFYRYIRHIPDPHVWSILQPRIRVLLEKSTRNAPESSAQAQLRAVRARRRAEDEVRKLHMAVGCYPHALRRVLGDCYGQTGSVRWRLINVSPRHFQLLSCLEYRPSGVDRNVLKLCQRREVYSLWRD
jgi:hypothetical protein